MRKKGSDVTSRVVVKDFNSRPREDVYASTPTPASVRIVLLRSTVKNHEVAPPVEEEVLVRPSRPLGQRGAVWRLKKAWRGLRKAPALFQDFLRSIMLELGFETTEADGTLYVHKEWGLATAVHVDDLIVTRTKERIKDFFASLEKKRPLP